MRVTLCRSSTNSSTNYYSNKNKMVKLLLPLILLSGVLMSEVLSLSVVNNETVSCDALSDIFFKTVLTDQRLFGVNITGTNDAKCLLGLREIMNQFPSLKVAPFLDSWGKFPSGLLYGNLFDLGNFDQCVRTSVTLSRLTGLVNGQYCFARVPLVNQQTQKLPALDETMVPEARISAASLMQIILGICVPDSCRAEFLTSVFQKAANSALNGALSGTSVFSCRTAKHADYRPIDVFAIILFSIVACLMVISSVYDFLMTYFEKPPVPILLAFSVFTNGKKLFAISTKKSPNNIDCLTGIRVLSMIWVVYGHTFSTSLVTPKINLTDMFHWLNEAWSLHVINATVSVDSFFFMSGVLVAWLGFRELDKTKGKLNVIMMYVHRYIRLTPALAAVVLFSATLSRIIGTGPLQRFAAKLDGCNSQTWWPVLLYIQNYYILPRQCIGQAWYLAIDFQLYVLSPLILIPMWKWGKKFAPVLVVLSLLSIGCVIATFMVEGYTDLKGLSNTDAFEKTYVPTHTRYSPWLVGLALGYYMHINRQRTFRLSKVLQLLGWVVSFVIFVSIIFAPYFSNHYRGGGTVFETAMYESLSRVSWSIGLAWVTFACHFGFGGVVDTFLSHPFWQPLGRLTYSLFLVHIFVLMINIGVMRTEVYFSNYTMILNFWGAFGISIIAAITLTLAFESPILVLEKLIFRRGDRADTAKVQRSSADEKVEVLPK